MLWLKIGYRYRLYSLVEVPLGDGEGIAKFLELPAMTQTTCALAVNYKKGIKQI